MQLKIETGNVGAYIDRVLSRPQKRTRIVSELPRTDGLRSEQIFSSSTSSVLTDYGRNLQWAINVKSSQLNCPADGMRRVEIEQELKEICAKKGIDENQLDVLGLQLTAVARKRDIDMSAQYPTYPAMKRKGLGGMLRRFSYKHIDPLLTKIHGIVK